MAVHAATQYNYSRTAALPNPAAITLMRWLRVDASATFKDCFSLSDDGNEFGTNYVWLGTDADGVTLEVEVWNDPDDEIQKATLFPLTPGAWYHVALVLTGSNVKVYLSSEDGTYDADAILSYNAAFTPPAVLGSMWTPIGTGSDSAAVKVFEAALTQNQVRKERDSWGTFQLASIYVAWPTRCPGSDLDRTGQVHDATIGGGTVTFVDDPLILQQQNATYAFRSASAVATGSTSLVITKPTGVVDRDILIGNITHKGAGYGVWPAGWTLVARNISGSTRVEQYWKRASSEGANYTITGLADTAAGAIRAYEGGPWDGDLIGGSASATYTGTKPYFPTLNIDQAPMLLMGGYGAGENNSPGATISGLGFGNEPDIYNASTRGGTSTGTDCVMAMADAIKVTTVQTPDTSTATVATAWETSGFAAESVALLGAYIPDVRIGADGSAAVTIFYPTCTPLTKTLYGAPQGTYTIVDSGRDTRGPLHPQYKLAPDGMWGGIAGTGGQDVIAPGTADIEQEYLMRWVIEDLYAQTISGNLRIVFPVSYLELPNVITVVYHVYAYISTGDDLETPRHVLVNNVVSATAWTTIVTWRQFLTAMTSGAAVDGDHLVVELGAQTDFIIPPFADDQAGHVRYGCATFSGVGLTLGTPLAVAGATESPWMELSGGVEIQTTVIDQPTNLDSSTPEVIAALPFTSGELQTSQNQSPNREVWYKWTATFTGQVIAYTWGGNCSQTVAAYHTTYPSAALDVNNLQTWLQQSQAALVLDVAVGEIYLFRVGNAGATTTVNYDTRGANTFTPNAAGGVLVFGLVQVFEPTLDDLFVNCQHVAVFRDTVLINLNSNLFGQTPTGAAIDYSGRSIPDLNGGFNTTARYLAMLFQTGPGAAGPVEMLNALTLNNTPGETEVNFIYDALNLDPSPPKNFASGCMDKAGNLWMGFFGDGYSVIGGISSDDSCAIRVIDATHTDDTGPWPVPQKFIVVQDVGGSDYVEIDAPNEFLYYTSSGTKIYRMDMVTGAIVVHAAVPNAAGPRPGTHGLRLLPPGDGSGGMLVTNGTQVVRLNAAGGIIQVYTPSVAERYQDIDKVEINVNGDKFWCSDQYSASIAKFDLDTGVQEEDLWTGMPLGQLSGMVGGFRAGLAPEEPCIGEVIGTRIDGLPYVPFEPLE